MREKIGMYLSADLQEALELGLREIKVNSLDAITENKQKGEITITINSKTRTVTVEDNGPGIPNAIDSDGVHMVVAAFTIPHSGSHFDGRAVNAIGSHGIGAKAVCNTASFLNIMNNDGKTNYSVRFESNDDGAFVAGTLRGVKSSHGLYVSYSPDPKIYGDTWFSEEKLKTSFEEIMKFYPQVKLTLDFDGNKSVFHVPGGLKEANTKMYYESDNLIISLGVANEESEMIKSFGNRLYLPEGGKFFTQFKTVMTKQVNTLSGLKLTGAQVQSQFTGYVCIFVTEPLFSNQAKTKISNTEVNLEISSALNKLLADFSKTKDWERMVKLLEGEMKAEEAAERARKKIKDALDGIKKGSQGKRVVAEKLKDCIQSGEKAWLAIAEGDSGLTGLLTGRDIETVAVLPIRGKGINCLKAPKEDYLDNQEVKELFTSLGCGVFENYNSKKLKYGNVLLGVDADEDGKAIMALVVTEFYVCAPEFLKEGRLWWLKAPLYYNSDIHSYIFTEEEWAKVKNKKGYIRAKGLGEYDPITAKEALFGKYKRWEQLKISNWDEFSKSVELLMGKDVKGRRDFLFNHIDFERIKFL